MKKITLAFKILTVLLVLTFAMANVRPAAAAGEVEIEFMGIVTEVNEGENHIVVKVTEEVSFDVYPVDPDFDFTTVAVDDLVKVEGTLDENNDVQADKIEVEEDFGVVKVKFCGELTEVGDGFLTVTIDEEREFTVLLPEDFDYDTLTDVTEVCVSGELNEEGEVEAVIVKPADDDDDEDEDAKTGFYCIQSEVQHPFGARLAERYGVDYEAIQEWFCDGLGWGQIMLALHTAELKGDDVDFSTYLERRQEGEGWGRIWKDLKLIGKDKEDFSPADKDKNGKPDKPGKPENTGKPDNKPNKPNNKPNKP